MDQFGHPKILLSFPGTLCSIIKYHHHHHSHHHHHHCHHHHYHHHHHHHLANKGLGHLLTHPSLTLREVLKAIIKYVCDKWRAKKVLKLNCNIPLLFWQICVNQSCTSIFPYIDQGKCPSNHNNLECSGHGVSKCVCLLSRPFSCCVSIFYKCMLLSSFFKIIKKKFV